MLKTLQILSDVVVARKTKHVYLLIILRRIQTRTLFIFKFLSLSQSSFVNLEVAEAIYYCCESNICHASPEMLCLSLCISHPLYITVHISHRFFCMSEALNIFSWFKLEIDPKFPDAVKLSLCSQH